MINDLISVIIPTYNRVNFIEQAIQSVLTQTYTHYEIIVVDDGSTDNTSDIVKRFEEPVKYFYQTNQGVSAARNHGFRQSVGQYIVFLDSDDWLLSDGLRILWTTANDGIADIVYGDAYLTDARGKRICRMSDYHPRPVEDTIEAFASGNGLGMLATMIKRSTLKQVEGPFDEVLNGYEDRDLFLRLRLIGARLIYVPEPICCYRFHGGNKSAPKSQYAEHRRKSLVQLQFKVLKTGQIASFSQSGQLEFFTRLLAGPLKGDIEGQDLVLQQPSFQDLSPKLRSQILYRTVAEGLVADMTSLRAISLLISSIRQYPRNLRPYVLLSTCVLGRIIQRWLIERYRRIGSGDDQVDPIIELLREKGAA